MDEPGTLQDDLLALLKVGCSLLVKEEVIEPWA